MKSFLNSPTPTGDEVLLREMNIASLEIEETESKIKKGGVTKKVTVNESRMVNHEELSPILECITKLTQQMSDLQGVTKQMSESQGAKREVRTSDADKTERRKNYTTSWKSFKCRKCREAKSDERCQHCFQCGSQNHQARQCP